MLKLVASLAGSPATGWQSYTITVPFSQDQVCLGCSFAAARPVKPATVCLAHFHSTITRRSWESRFGDNIRDDGAEPKRRGRPRKYTR